MHSAEKILARDKKHTKKGCHLISFLWYTHAIAICVCERERESQWKQSAGRTASTTQTLAKYSINTAKVCVCVCLLFFVCFRLKSYSQVMRNTEKSMSSHRFGILGHCNSCVCMHVSHWKESAGQTASMTHKTREHKTKKNTTAEVHVSQWKEFSLDVVNDKTLFLQPIFPDQPTDDGVARRNVLMSSPTIPPDLFYQSNRIYCVVSIVCCVYHVCRK